MEQIFEDLLERFATRTLAGKSPRGEIAAATTYAREIIRLRGLLSETQCATVAHMTDTTPTNNTILQWVDSVPLPTGPQWRHRSTEYDALVDDLKNHPGQWALVGDGTQGVRKTQTEQLRQRGLTVKTRTTPDGAVDDKGNRLVAVYAAYQPA